MLTDRVPSIAVGRGEGECRFDWPATGDTAFFDSWQNDTSSWDVSVNAVLGKLTFASNLLW